MEDMIVRGSDHAEEILRKAKHKTAFEESPEEIEAAQKAAKELAESESEKAKEAEKGKKGKTQDA